MNRIKLHKIVYGMIFYGISNYDAANKIVKFIQNNYRRRQYKKYSNKGGLTQVSGEYKHLTRKLK